MNCFRALCQCSCVCMYVCSCVCVHSCFNICKLALPVNCYWALTPLNEGLISSLCNCVLITHQKSQIQGVGKFSVSRPSNRQARSTNNQGQQDKAKGSPSPLLVTLGSTSKCRRIIVPTFGGSTSTQTTNEPSCPKPVKPHIFL